MLTGWVLIAVFFNIGNPKMLSQPGLLPMAAATSAVFADKKSCESAKQVLVDYFHWQVYVTCQPQTAK